MKRKHGRCWSCEAVMINGLYCHEAGCPEAWKDEQRECSWCGNLFVPEDRMQKTCCPECSEAYNT